MRSKIEHTGSMPLGQENRENRRYSSIARARIRGAFPGDGILKDISVTGCHIECTMHPDIKVGLKYKTKILPEKASKIGDFELAAECKWIRMSDYSCDIGLVIVESPKGKAFQRYVDYLSWGNHEPQ
jgi:hypothetical protein